MEYSAQNAPLSWATILWVVPHLAIGVVLLVTSIRGTAKLKGLSGVPARIVGTFFGLVFFGIASISLTMGSIETSRCRTALATGDYETIHGVVSDFGIIGKIGGRNFTFSVDGQKLDTAWEGLECDCGFLRPLGNDTRPRNGDHVVVKLFNGEIVYYRTASNG